MAGNADYTFQVASILQARGVQAVHPREVADEYFSSLSFEEQEKYYNNPTFAFISETDESKQNAAISKCLERFNRSTIVETILDDYIKKQYPNETDKEAVLNKIASFCPTVQRSGDIRQDAYTVVMSDRLEKQKQQEEADKEILFAKVAAAVKENEPYVASASFVSDNKNEVTYFLEKLTKEVTGTVQHMIDKRAHTEDKFAELLKQQQAEIKSLKKEVSKQTYSRNQSPMDYRRQNASYTHRGNYYNNGYAESGHVSMRNLNIHPIIIANVFALLVVFLVCKISDVNGILAYIGLLMGIAGVFFKTTRDKMGMIIGGYAFVVIWFLWSILL